MLGRCRGETSAEFIPAAKFKGSMPGYIFQQGAHGILKSRCTPCSVTELLRDVQTHALRVRTGPAPKDMRVRTVLPARDNASLQ